MAVRSRPAAMRPPVRIVRDAALEDGSEDGSEDGFESLPGFPATGAAAAVAPAAPCARGARGLLGDSFLADLLADWREHGAGTIGQVRAERPHDYLRLVAGLVPRTLSSEVEELDDLDDEQLAAQLRAVAARLAAAGVDLGAGGGTTPPAQPPGGL